jgi:phage portal protein BeeE
MLFFISERNTYYAEFNLASLLRGRIKDRYDAYAVGIANGFMKPSEARKLENFEPDDDTDKFFISQNLRGINEPTNKITEASQ